jgi:valyl-tRNA synthetase
MAGLFDAAAERANLVSSRQAQSQVESLEKQLSNEGFTSRAKAEVVAQTRERLEAARTRLAGIEKRLGELE